ncbi:MAG: hypothetical protein AB1405_16375 [Bdellovibrionota bacterium]
MNFEGCCYAFSDDPRSESSCDWSRRNQLTAPLWQCQHIEGASQEPACSLIEETLRGHAAFTKTAIFDEVWMDAFAFQGQASFNLTIGMGGEVASVEWGPSDFEKYPRLQDDFENLLKETRFPQLGADVVRASIVLNSLRPPAYPAPSPSPSRPIVKFRCFGPGSPDFESESHCALSEEAASLRAFEVPWERFLVNHPAHPGGSLRAKMEMRDSLGRVGRAEIVQSPFTEDPIFERTLENRIALLTFRSGSTEPAEIEMVFLREATPAAGARKAACQENMDVSVTGEAASHALRSADSVSRRARQYLPALRVLYNHFRRRNPQAPRGLITFRFTVRADGTVHDIELICSVFGQHPQFEKDTADRIGKIQFEPIPHGTVQVEFPINFAPPAP